jgi:hypothetical protein
MKKTFPIAVLAAVAVCGLTSCADGLGPRDVSQLDSPGVKSTAYLPPSPNDAATGSNTLNTSLAVVGGQTTDSSNPIPPGFPATSAALG